MTDKTKIEIITKVMQKAKKDTRLLSQKELGIVTKLSYGAKLNDFGEKELEEVKHEMIYEEIGETY